MSYLRNCSASSCTLDDDEKTLLLNFEADYLKKFKLKNTKICTEHRFVGHYNFTPSVVAINEEVITIWHQKVKHCQTSRFSLQ